MRKDDRDTAKAIEDLQHELRAELRAIKDSLQGMTELKDEIQQVLKENCELKAENDKLTRRLDELEQYQRSNNLEIKGIPLDGEPLSIVQKISVIVGEEITEQDIDICHRVPTARHDGSNIVVRLVRRNKRKAILNKAKKVRMDAKKLGFETSSTVYVNEHLTRYGKQLLGVAIKRKKEVRWKFVWTAGCKVFVRKDEGSSVVRMTCMDDLEKMTANEE